MNVDKANNAVRDLEYELQQTKMRLDAETASRLMVSESEAQHRASIVILQQLIEAKDKDLAASEDRVATLIVDAGRQSDRQRAMEDRCV